MKYQQFYKKSKIHSLTGAKKHAKCVFSPRPSTKSKLWVGTSRRRGTLPFKIVGYNFNVEYGLRLKPPPNPWLRSTVVIMTLFIMLPLLWWLNNSNASIEPLLNERNWFQQTSVVHSLEQSKPAIVNQEQSLPLLTKATLPLKNSVSSHDSQAFSTQKVSTVSHDIQTTSTQTSPWLHLTIQSGENLSMIFRKHKLNLSHLFQIMDLEEYAPYLRQLQIDQELHIKPDLLGNIEDIILVLNEEKELHIYKEEDEFAGEIRQIGVQSEIITLHGTLNDSLSNTAQQIGLPDKLLAQFIQIFKWKIDLKQDLQPGDQFTVVFEQHTFEETQETGDVLAAELINKGQVYRALRYTNPVNYTDYYTPLGDSLYQLALLSAPVEYTRISSHFGDRKHPIFNRYHFHTGIDYAAQWGTPVIAAGDGIVEFKGRKGGYGKVIVLEHHQRVETIYAHLSKYVKELKVGDEVVQGQIIGYVGRSGRATGPHLHYEVRLDQTPINPQQLLNFPLSLPVAEEYQSHFIKKTQKLISQLDTVNSMSSPIAFKTPSKSFQTTGLTLLKEENKPSRSLVSLEESVLKEDSH